MGAIGGMLGLSGDASGTGFAAPVAADTTGMANLQNAYQKLQQVAAGQGPNPAMAQYNANIQDLAKQQAGAISSVQGISPALATRMASQQGSAAMQNAAAKGAAVQAGQQLGAIGQMGNVAGMQQGAANQMQSNMNNVNGALAGQGMQNQAGFMGGLLGGAGAAMMPFAEGGPVSSYDAPDLSVPFTPPAEQAKTRSLLSQFLAGDASAPSFGGASALQRGMTEFGAGLGYQMRQPGNMNAGQGPTMANAAALPAASVPYTQPYGLGFGAAPPFPPGMAKGGMAKDYRSGGVAKANAPGQKAVKKGNSYANDKIPAMLSEGEVVIPRNVMQSPDPVRASADFVANVIAKRRAKR